MITAGVALTAPVNTIIARGRATRRSKCDQCTVSPLSPISFWLSTSSRCGCGPVAFMRSGRLVVKAVIGPRCSQQRCC